MQLNEFKNAKVLVVGDLMLDQYIHGEVDRISPEAPVPVIKPKYEESRLGGAANVASNISALGAKTKLLGIVGKDQAGLEFKRLLKKFKIQSKLVNSKLPTVTKQRIVVAKQQLLRLDREEFFMKEDASKLKSYISADLSKYSVLVLSDYGKGSLQDIEGIIKLAKKKGCKVLIDPKGKDFNRYKGASIITPNYKEFCEVVGVPKDEMELMKKSTKLITKLDLQALLITRGSDGMTLIVKDNKSFVRNDLPTKAVEVFDVSGAGDTVIGTFATSLACGKNVLEACKLANLAAGIVVGKFGTSVTDYHEIFSSLEQGNNPKMLGLNEVIQSLEKDKADKRKIVFTNGCFDILHMGHITYLQKAKELGSKLIVAVNSDSSVKNLKGSKRPINKLIDRMTVLSALECVDYVVSFSDDNPEKIIKRLKPDVLVKGSDYKLQEI